MKKILISIKPKWVAKILNGEKTIEIRKTLSNCELPVEVYIYCTKEDNLCCIKRDRDRYVCGKDFDLRDFPYLSSGYEGKGKIVGKFLLKEILTLNVRSALKGTCVSYDVYKNYCGDRGCYGWVISDLEIFDKPIALEQKAPQSWCYLRTEEQKNETK